MKTKICKDCGIEKDIDEYEFRNDTKKHRNICKACNAQNKKNKYIQNRDIRINKMRDYYSKNKEEINEKRREEYNTCPLVRERISVIAKASRVRNNVNVRAGKTRYRKDNPEKIKESRKNHKITHPEYYTSIKYRLSQSLRARIRDALSGKSKSDKTMVLLGCDINHFREHLESHFREGMSWENYGIDGWHIDHIIPCNSFNLQNIEDQKKCFHFSNLQPLWYYENCSKSDKLNYQIPLSIPATSV